MKTSKYIYYSLVATALFVAFIVPQVVADISTEQRINIIRDALGLKEGASLLVQEEERSYEVPFLSLTNKLVYVVQQNLLAGRAAQDSLAVRLIFSSSGQLLRIESVQTVSDPWRKNKAVCEQSMSAGGESIAGIPKLKEPLNVGFLWDILCQQIPMGEVQEFNLTLVEYRFRDGSQHPVFILNIWGLENPLDVPDIFPEGLKNRVRILLDMEGSIISKDNLL